MPICLLLKPNQKISSDEVFTGERLHRLGGRKHLSLTID